MPLTCLFLLLQIGLDGIRMLDPSTSRTLRIYPLDTLTRWDVSATSFCRGLCVYLLTTKYNGNVVFLMDGHGCGAWLGFRFNRICILGEDSSWFWSKANKVEVKQLYLQYFAWHCDCSNSAGDHLPPLSIVIYPHFKILRFRLALLCNTLTPLLIAAFGEKVLIRKTKAMNIWIWTNT